MRISFFQDNFDDISSFSTIVINEANYLLNENEVFLLCNKNHSKKTYRFKIIELCKSKNKLKSFICLLKCTKKEKLDLIFFEHSSFYYLFIKLFVKIKVVWQDHGSIWWRHRLINGKMNKLWRERIIVKYADAIISLTNHNKNGYKKFFPSSISKVHVVPNFVTVPLPEIGYSCESKTIITVGRCDGGKDYFTTISAFKEATKDHADWSLFIYGDGPLLNDLNNFISKEHLKDRVKIIQNEAQMNIYKDKSFFVFNSWHEGMPLVLIEACSVGLPIISYDCPSGPSDIVKNNINGYLIKLGDFDDYVLKIKKLIGDSELRDSMSINAKNISTIFSIDKSMFKLKEIIVSLVH